MIRDCIFLFFKTKIYIFSKFKAFDFRTVFYPFFPLFLVLGKREEKTKKEKEKRYMEITSLYYLDKVYTKG